MRRCRSRRRSIGPALPGGRIHDVEALADDPSTIYLATASGGLWKTTNRGQTWSNVFDTLAVSTFGDVALAPSGPDVLYASTGEQQNRQSSSWGNGVYRSDDGGETWRELTDGIPSGPKGRIGLAVARTAPRILAAVVEHSTDGGTGTYRSEDGGRSFREIALRPTYDVGVDSDHHDLWIDPGDPRHLYLVGDAGLHESYDRGRSFRRINNLSIGQFYDVGVDMRDPYRVYGGMQDNHSWMGPSRPRRWMGIPDDDWKQVGFGDGMHWQIDPTDHRNAYGNAQNGDYTRFDPETGDMLSIRPLAPEGEEYRFDWAWPSLVSRHDPDRVYVGGNRLFVSDDLGESWIRTEDLSRGIDRDTLERRTASGISCRRRTSSTRR